MQALQVFHDDDISCTVPQPSSTEENDVDWLGIHISFSKILSYAYSRLFSARAMSYSMENYDVEFCRIRDDLETWRALIPEKYRPGLLIRTKHFLQPHLNVATLHTHFRYHSLQIAISRLLVHVYSGQRCAAVENSKSLMMQAARSILEAVQFIPLEASTPPKYV